MEKNTYRLEVKSKRTHKKIKHILNKPDYIFYADGVFCKLTDERMKDIACGVVYGLMKTRDAYVEVYKKNEQGDYVLVYTEY